MSRLSVMMALALTLVRVAAAAPFEPDAHTLLLAHFERNVQQADYANGLSLFAGNGAALTDEGYYGKAIDLRARGLFPDFMNACSDMTPRYDGWGFHSRGNVDPTQGTFECWFKPADPKLPKLLWSAGFLGTELSRTVRHPGSGNYVGFGIILNSAAMRYWFPTLGGQVFEGDIAFGRLPGFAKTLGPDNWRHFALTWSQGELVVYLDGRPLLSHDMTDQLGLVLVSNPTRYVNMSDCIVDELRISNVVRYRETFEPNWRDGRRPDYAFTGNPAVQRYEPRYLDAPLATPTQPRPAPQQAGITLGDWTVQFDPRDGAVTRLTCNGQSSAPAAEGLQVHLGLERTPLAALSATAPRQRHDGGFVFHQQFEHNLHAEHVLAPQGETLAWAITLRNDSKDELWLEPKLGLPLPLANVDEVFDNIEGRRQIHLPRHRDEYCYALPFTAASGDGRFVGVGIDPRTDLSDIVSQWVPRPAALRQGTKIVLGPGEQFTLPFVLVRGRSDFATLDAIDAYQDLFPELYRLWKDTTIYSYMPATQYYYADRFVDMKRQGYAGGFWGHGPGHDKGDEFASPEFWDRDEFMGDKHYADYTTRIQRMWGSVYNVRKFITAYYRQSYDNWYPVRRFHTCPDMTPTYIIQKLWPGYQPNEDPLCFGQYYKPSWQSEIVNEYRNPIGDHFMDTTRNYFRQTMGYCPGFINDMSHAGSLYRHNDVVAQRTPGRSFARDLGSFIRKALGRRQRYEVLQGFRDNGSRATFWSDGGAFSYTLCAFSSGIAIEGAGVYKDLVGSGQYVVPARNLLGEKPLTAMTHLNDDWIGYYLKPDDFPTMKDLRDYYRYCERQLVLWCLDRGVTLDPTSYFWGRQFSWESAPVLVESGTRGRQRVPAAEVADPLWVRRSGQDLNAMFIVGNHEPRAVTTDVLVHNRYFRAAPLFVPFFGGELHHRVDGGRTTIPAVTVPPRDYAALNAVALVASAGPLQAVANLAGDGLQVRLTLKLDSAKPARLWVQTFAPAYRIASARIDGRAVTIDDEPLGLEAGKRSIEVEYQAAALPFDAAAWKQVELIREGQPNFRVQADPGVTDQPDPAMPQNKFEIGFERGTARMLAEFVEAYDDENGRIGDMRSVAISDQPRPDYSGWTVVLRRDPLVPLGRVQIEATERQIIVEGPTQGQMRRAMVMLMRLVDRTYPHIGMFQPLRYRKQAYDHTRPVPMDKWIVRTRTREFFQQIADQRFWVKPILDARYEPLYASDNTDFAGKYELRWTPWIVEPTYGDEFVYGYSGPGKADTTEELRRGTRPEQPKAAAAKAETE